jgi:hypothetical protein
MELQNETRNNFRLAFPRGEIPTGYFTDPTDDLPQIYLRIHMSAVAKKVG